MFIKSSFLPLTPIAVMILIILLTTAYIGSRGITNIARMCEIFGIVFIITAILLHTAMLFIGDVKYIMPFFEAGQIKRYITGMSKLVVPFLGVEIMLLIPFGRGNKKSTSVAFFSILFLGLFYIFVVESSTMITGPHSIITTESALVEALRETRLPMTFLLDRPDLAFVLVGLAGFICTLSVAFHMLNSSISHMILQKSNSGLMLFLAPIVYIFSAFIINDKTTYLLLDYIIPYLGLLVVFFIPILLLIIAKVKKL